MKIRLGYVAIAKKLGKKITSSSTVTFTNYNKISTSEKKLEKKSKKISVGIFYPYVFRHIKNVNHLQKNQKKERSRKND